MVIDYLIELGYSEEEANKIRSAHSLNEYRDETLLNNIKRNYDWLLNNGYSEENIKKMTILLPALFSMSIENLEKKQEDFMKIGYSKKEFI